MTADERIERSHENETLRVGVFSLSDWQSRFRAGRLGAAGLPDALVGTVTDSGGGVLPGATVVAVNTGTKDTYEATTNDQGQYNIQFVRPGGYEITVSMQGFQASRTTGIELTTNQVVRTNAVLQVGAVTEEVQVEARAAVLATDQATVSDTIDAQQLTELPSRGRNVWQMAEITPGVQRGTRDGTWIGAGQRDIQNSLTLDGINSAANLMPSTSMQPIADAVEEVVVQTGSTSAEFGSYLGVHVNVVTKSGTNSPHGSLSLLPGRRARRPGFFEDRTAPANPRSYNQFAAQADGPLVIPGLFDGRNRTFFMMAYEAIRQGSQLAAIGTVPTALMRQGNFSEVSAQLRNPLTGRPYPGNIIPRLICRRSRSGSCRSISRRRTGRASPPTWWAAACERQPGSDPVPGGSEHREPCPCTSATTGRMSSSTTSRSFRLWASSVPARTRTTWARIRTRLRRTC